MNPDNMETVNPTEESQDLKRKIDEVDHDESESKKLKQEEEPKLEEITAKSIAEVTPEGPSDTTTPNKKNPPRARRSTKKNTESGDDEEYIPGSTDSTPFKQDYEAQSETPGSEYVTSESNTPGKDPVAKKKKRPGRPRKDQSLNDDYEPPLNTPSRMIRGQKKEKRPTRDKKTGNPAVDEILERLAPGIQQCYHLLTQLKNNKVAWPFNEPVDAVKHNIPDYYQIVKNPMDLGTIGDLLLKGRYDSPETFAKDVHLVFSNCYLYNPPLSDVVKMAQTLENVFVEKFKHVTSEVPEKRERKQVERVIETIDHSFAQSPVTTTQKPKKKVIRTPKTPLIDSREMTQEEKLELSQDITHLEQHHLVGVVKIIQKRAPKASSTGEQEVEIDLDKLDPVTLREIEKFVAKNLGKKKKRGPVKKMSRPDVVQQQQQLPPPPMDIVQQPPTKEESDSSESESSSDSEVEGQIKSISNENGPKPLTQGN